MGYRTLHKFLLSLVIFVVIAAAVGAAFILNVAVQAGLVVMLLALLWIGWELRRIANYVAECSDELDTIQARVSNIEDGVTTAGADILHAINTEATAVTAALLEIENKLD